MPDPARPLNRLQACRSVPHRAILGLMAPALGAPVPDTLAQDLMESPPGELVKLATYTYVHTVIVSAFRNAPELQEAAPRDLQIYFSEMQKANLQRNGAIRTQLAEVAGILAGEGIETVALKGCAELLCPMFQTPGMRFLSDIDLLVRETDIEAAYTALEAAGAAPDPDHAIPQRQHHHLQPLIRRGWLVPVELHHALGTKTARDLLPADDVFAQSQPSSLPGVRVPDPLHRLMHLVAHGELSKRPFGAFFLSLRDCLEFQQMKAVLPAGTLAAARGRFAAAGSEQAFNRLAAAAAAVFEPLTASPEAGSGCADRMLRLFGRPAEQKLRELAGWAGFYGYQFACNPELRRYYLRTLASRSALAHVFSFHKGWLQRF